MVINYNNRCIWITIILSSTIYEIYEYIVFKGHDYGDIFYNVLGVSIALLIRKFI